MVCIVGKMAHLLWLVFECACIHSENVFCDLFLLFFLGSLLGMAREKGHGRVGPGEDAWSVQYDSTELLCSQRTVINSDASN